MAPVWKNLQLLIIQARFTNQPKNVEFVNSKLALMPGTFSQLYVQIVFAVKGRENLIRDRWKTELHKYIAGIIKGKGQKPIIVNGISDHIHAFVGLRPARAIADIARDI